MLKEEQERICGEITVPIYDISDKLIFQETLGSAGFAKEKGASEETIEMTTAVEDRSLILRFVERKRIVMIKTPDLAEAVARAMLNVEIEEAPVS